MTRFWRWCSSMVERLLRKQRVDGSSPSTSSTPPDLMAAYLAREAGIAYCEAGYHPTAGWADYKRRRAEGQTPIEILIAIQREGVERQDSIGNLKLEEAHANQ